VAQLVSVHVHHVLSSLVPAPRPQLQQPAAPSGAASGRGGRGAINRTKGAHVELPTSEEGRGTAASSYAVGNAEERAEELLPPYERHFHRHHLLFWAPCAEWVNRRRHGR
jgi:hypothetical protein